MSKEKNILKQMFDVRPVDEAGEVDWKRIQDVYSFLDLTGAQTNKEKEGQKRLERIRIREKARPSIFQRSRPQADPFRKTPVEPKRNFVLKDKEALLAELARIEKEDRGLWKEIRQTVSTGEVLPARREPFSFVKKTRTRKEARRVNKISFSWKELRGIVPFLISCLLVSGLVLGFSWLEKGWQLKSRIEVQGYRAYESLNLAKEGLSRLDIGGAQANFENATQNFVAASKEISVLNETLLFILERLPGGKTVSSAKHLIKVGEYISLAGKSLSQSSQALLEINLFDVFKSSDGENNLLFLLNGLRNNLNDVEGALGEIDSELKLVEEDALPIEIGEKVILLKKGIPPVKGIIRQLIETADILLESLGGVGPRKYLILIQNPSEQRPTGGFLGTYGLLGLKDGRTENIFIDGTYNLDGQLLEKIIPPRPLQKVATAWSMHDANWFFDFPTSSKKIAWFYEKAGGPTVDGVLALNPQVIEKILEIIGPIEMAGYDMPGFAQPLMINSKNFLEVTQYQVEAGYDKTLNQPKKFIADLFPKILEKISLSPPEEIRGLFKIILEALQEKELMLYFFDESIENKIIEQGWGGNVLHADKDYLAVVNSNMGGNKTDKVIEEKTEHLIEINENGEVFETLNISRTHKGGKTDYAWWNNVNSNYLKVYVPLGSKLISSEGFDTEVYAPPINYEEEGFKNDPLVASLESSIKNDSRGVEIFEESGKTVFAGWVYTEPGKTQKVVFKYRLPFQVNLSWGEGSYSILIQKQSGSQNVLKTQFKLPQNWKISWQHPDSLSLINGLYTTEAILTRDKIIGLMLKR